MSECTRALAHARYTRSNHYPMLPEITRGCPKSPEITNNVCLYVCVCVCLRECLCVSVCPLPPATRGPILPEITRDYPRLPEITRYRPRSRIVFVCVCVRARVCVCLRVCVCVCKCPHSPTTRGPILPEITRDYPS